MEVEGLNLRSLFSLGSGVESEGTAGAWVGVVKGLRPGRRPGRYSQFVEVGDRKASKAYRMGRGPPPPTKESGERRELP